jgi:hypothetical protein
MVTAMVMVLARLMLALLPMSILKVSSEQCLCKNPHDWRDGDLWQPHLAVYSVPGAPASN